MKEWHQETAHYIIAWGIHITVPSNTRKSMASVCTVELPVSMVLTLLAPAARPSKHSEVETPKLVFGEWFFIWFCVIYIPFSNLPFLVNNLTVASFLLGLIQRLCLFISVNCRELRIFHQNGPRVKNCVLRRGTFAISKEQIESHFRLYGTC